MSDIADQAGSSLVHDPKSIIIALVPKLPALISVFCSATIIRKVYFSPTKWQNIYHRIIFGLSCSDVLASSVYFLGTWLIPAKKMGAWGLVFGSSGNHTTCSISGFFTQFAVSSPIYNATLSWYYLLTVYYGWKERHLRAVEKWFHIIPISFALTSSVIGAACKLYGNVEWLCWINPDVPNKEDMTSAQKNFQIFQWAFLFGPVWICLAIGTVIFYVLWKKMKENEAKMKKYKFSTRSMRSCLLASSSSNSRLSVNASTRGSLQGESSVRRLSDTRRASPLRNSKNKDSSVVSTTSAISNDPNMVVFETAEVGKEQRVSISSESGRWTEQEDFEAFDQADLEAQISGNAISLPRVEEDGGTEELIPTPQVDQTQKISGVVASLKDREATVSIGLDKLESIIDEEIAMGQESKTTGNFEAKHSEEIIAVDGKSISALSTDNDPPVISPDGSRRIGEPRKNKESMTRVSFLEEAPTNKESTTDTVHRSGQEGNDSSSRHNRFRFSAMNFSYLSRGAPSSSCLSESSTLTSHRSSVETKMKNALMSKQIAIQGMLYTGAFFVTWLFPTLQRITELTAKKNFFVFQFFDTTLLPLQGLLNFFIYIRPRVKTYRNANRDVGYWKAVWVVASEIE